FHILFNGCCVGLFPDDEGHCQQPGDIASILGSLIPINMERKTVFVLIFTLYEEKPAALEIIILCNSALLNL
ncbi:hypothetical protein D917_07937, partial [Trichinella nativa]